MFYDDISTALNDLHTHFMVLCGNFNAKTGMKLNTTEVSLGNFGEGRRNDTVKLLNFPLQNNLFQMNSFFYRPNGRWTWRSPGDRTKNEIDFIITNKEYIVKDVTMLNKLTTVSDHRMVQAKVMIYISKERHKQIRKPTSNMPWVSPSDLVSSSALLIS